MAEIKLRPFRRTRALQARIEEFLDKVGEGALVFEEGVLRYVEQGCDDIVGQRMERLRELELRGDELRRGIATTLFAEMLIPDARGDVLELLDDMDHILDGLKHAFLNLNIERAEIPAEYAADVRELVTAVTRCVESTVIAARAYFRDPRAARDHVHKIGFYESEADRITISLRQRIFASDLGVARKMQFREAVMNIDRVADDAEDTGDRIAIYAVKRSL